MMIVKQTSEVKPVEIRPIFAKLSKLRDVLAELKDNVTKLEEETKDFCLPKVKEEKAENLGTTDPVPPIEAYIGGLIEDAHDINECVLSIIARLR